MKMIQELLTCVLAIVALVGCGVQRGGYSEPKYCVDCAKEIRDGLPYWDELLCTECFLNGDYMICRSCRDIYSPRDEESASGYCEECAKTTTWYCSVCENRIDINEMADFGNGYYLCGQCLLNNIEIPSEMPDDLAKGSWYISRNEYLEKIGIDILP